MIPTPIRDIAAALEQWAPRASAQSYDNVGLQVGDASRPVERAVIALDLTHAVIDEAMRHQAALIITHHPLIFRPRKQITADDTVGHLVLRLAESGIALYCAHTNLDAAVGGVSFALARQLGLEAVTFLEPMADALYKLVTFAPRDQAGAVRDALLRAGAGETGVRTGPLLTTDAARFDAPSAEIASGTGGRQDGVRIEVEVPRWHVPAVRAALLAVHPDPAAPVDLYPVVQAHRHAGLGAIGSLPEAETLADFLARVATRLAAPALRYAGDARARIRRVAVCGGSGSDFTPAALRAGADAYVTADVTYHKFFDVLGVQGTPRMALIDPGHYESEAMTETLLRQWLAERFAHITWIQTATRTSPMQTYVPPPP